MATQPDNYIYPAPTSSIRRNDLTKREYFAAIAMQGILANNVYSEHTRGTQKEIYFEAVAVDAVELADTLIRALNLSDD